MHTRIQLLNVSLPCLPVTTVRSPTRFPLPSLATSTLPPGAESSGRRIRTLPYRIKYSLSPLSPYLISASPFCAQFAASQVRKRKGKDKTTPFGEDFKRSQVLYRAAQNPVKYNTEAFFFCRHGLTSLGLQFQSVGQMAQAGPSEILATKH